MFEVDTLSKFEFHNVKSDYMLSFIYTYKKNKVLFMSKIKKNKYIVEIINVLKCLKVIYLIKFKKFWVYCKKNLIALFFLD